MQCSFLSVGFRRSTLSGALIVAMGMGFATAASHANEPPQRAEPGKPATERTRTFDIAAQPAAAALNAFASQADITLIFSNALVAGIDTNQVRGAYDIQEALTRLLEGTRLSYSRIGETTMAINKDDGASAAEPRTRVFAETGDDVTELGGVRVEGHYIGERASGARFEVPLKNVPYSITTYTSEFME